jgi:putative peptide zinc metalloprotease protein
VGLEPAHRRLGAAPALELVAVSEALLDPSWHRVATLRPRLRGHVRLHRHQYRGQVWHVLQDNATGHFHRFSQTAYQVIGLMDGQRTLQAIWETACSRLGDDAPTQGEVIRLLHQLHSADVLQSDVLPDTEELLRRYDRQRRGRWLQSLRSPLAIRVPLLDPDRLLEASLPLARLLFGWPGAVLWLAVVGLAAVQVGLHWPELTENVTERVLSPQNLLLLWLAFPLVKTLHEAGHALAVKVWGGEVHQVGVMLLVLTPVPYVDASASTAFREKHRRAVVGGAGMLVELFLAALAMHFWAAAEPGLARTLAYDVMLIAGVSTLLFNGNPLLRFDGYYILSDLVEIPNLAGRANRYLFYLIQRHAFGLRELESPATAPGEAAWFLVYALASFAYRVALYFAIALFVAGQLLAVGVLLALWAAYSQFVQPLAKGLKFLATSPRLRRCRRRAVAITGAMVGTLAGALLLAPLPLATVAQGVAWVPDRALVRAPLDGFVVALRVAPGATVAEGDPLVLLEDPLLPVRVEALEAQLDAVTARHRFFFHTDRVQAQIAREEMGAIEAQLARKREQLRSLTVRAGASGRLAVPTPEDLPGRFVRQGELLAYVVGQDTVRVRAVVSQDDVDLVRQRTERADVRLAERLDRVYPASLSREVPAATRDLPSAALGTEGGGPLAVDPSEPGGRTAFQPVFPVEVLLPEDVALERIGGRVYVRFGHGLEPLARRWYRGLRQVFLSRLDV